MKIAIVGAGALGCLVGGYLKCRAKDDVWIYDKNVLRAQRLSTDGITVEGVGGSISARPRVTSKPSEIGACELVVLCVKSYSTEEACAAIGELMGEKTQILTLQNGIGNVQILKDHFGIERVMAGITNHGATLTGIGRVRHAGKGETVIGRADGKVLGIIRDTASVLTKAGFETKVSRDIESVIWSKVVISVGINAITAIAKIKNGMVSEYASAREVMRLAVQEAVKVVKRKRVKLAYDDPIQKVESVCKATSDNVSSMLQDILKKKRTEIDFINGAIVRQGKALGIQTPVNDVLTNIVKTIEASYAESVEHI